MRGGALQRGHGRLPIAHNETALSAGSGAEGKHGGGAQPGQKEAEDRGGGGECFKCFLPASLPDSPPGWVSGGLAGFQSRGRACPESYVGSILRRPSCPNCEDRGVPRPAGLSSWLRVCIFTLCQTLRAQEKKGFGWRQLAPVLSPAGGTSEPHRRGRSLPASWSPRWFRGREYGDAFFFSASGLERWKLRQIGAEQSDEDRKGEIAIHNKTKLVWGWRMRAREGSCSCSLVGNPAPFTTEPWSRA